MRLPWQASSYKFTLSLQGAWIQSLVQELRSHVPLVVVKKKKRSEFTEASCRLRSPHAATPSSIILNSAKAQQDGRCHGAFWKAEGKASNVLRKYTSSLQGPSSPLLFFHWHLRAGHAGVLIGPRPWPESSFSSQDYLTSTHT